MVGHVGGHETPFPCHGSGLLQGEAIAAHQDGKAPIAAQAVDHADAGQVITDLLPHADAVSALVLRWFRLEVVVDAVQTADEGVVELFPFGCEFAVAEVNPSVVADAEERPLARSAAVGTTPDASTKLEISEGHGGGGSLLAVALIHRAGDEGQGAGIGKGFLLPIPALQQVELNGAGIDVEAEGLAVGRVAEGSCSLATGFGPGGGVGGAHRRASLGKGRRNRHQSP